MASNFVEFYVQLVNQRTGLPIDDDSGLYNVLTAGDPAELTAYSDDRGTSLTLPATMTNGIIQFWLDVATTSCDITILTAGGRSYFLQGITISNHRIEVNTESSTYRFIVPYEMTVTADGGVFGTGFELVKGMKVKDVFLHKTDVVEGLGSGMVLDVGTSVNPNGFVDGITASATGFDMNDLIWGSNTTAVSGATAYVALVQTRGADLVEYSVGMLTGTTEASKGFFQHKPYMNDIVVTASRTVVWAVNGTSASATGKGYIYIEYDLMETAGN